MHGRGPAAIQDTSFGKLAGDPSAPPAEVRGAMIHDARIAAICRSQGVMELGSADRDFSRFPGVSVRNPLTD